MSSRVTRTLLRLYPRRIRDRYGEELLDLEDELRSRGEVSRPQLIRDMLTGALMTWHPRQRRRLVTAAVLTGAVFVVAGLIVAGTVIGERGKTGSPASEPHHRAQLVARVAYPGGRGWLPYGTPCPVAAGSSCSLTPCTEFIAQSTDEDADVHNIVPTIHRSERFLGTRCPAHPPSRPQSAVVMAQPAPTSGSQAAPVTAQP